MAISVVRLGSAREENEGIRIGTVRRPPRGVAKADFAKLNYYDVWLPQLAPSAELVSWIKNSQGSTADWKRFEKKFIHELSAADTQRLIDVLVAFSKRSDFSIGCYCEDEEKCHRSTLKKVFKARGASIR
jgi:uncharacterized protein YeaO (DUF488 family)